VPIGKDKHRGVVVLRSRQVKPFHCAGRRILAEVSNPINDIAIINTARRSGENTNMLGDRGICLILETLGLKWSKLSGQFFPNAIFAHPRRATAQ